MARYEISDRISRKFWEIRLRGNTIEVHFGRAGAGGQRRAKASHAFQPLWKKIAPVVMSDIPPSGNVCVKVYRKQFPKL